MDTVSLILDPEQLQYHYYKFPSELKCIKLLNYDLLALSYIRFNIPVQHSCSLQVIYSDSTHHYYFYPASSLEKWDRLDFKAINQLTKVKSLFFEYENLLATYTEQCKLCWEVSFD